MTSFETEMDYGNSSWAGVTTTSFETEMDYGNSSWAGVTMTSVCTQPYYVPSFPFRRHNI
jgi:hypothetical protein